MKESMSPGQKPALGAAWVWFFSRGWSCPGEAPPVASAPVWCLLESLVFPLTSLPQRLSLLSSPRMGNSWLACIFLKGGY